MTHNWKPGDVADINGNIGIYDGDGFYRPAVLAFCHADSINGRGARPLLVIDPEDRKQVERLRDLTLQALRDQLGDDRALVAGDLGNAMQAAFRSLLESEPEEPTGLGAVVRDGRGEIRTRIRSGSVWCWRDNRSGQAGWTNLPRPITVLSEGWREATDE